MGAFPQTLAELSRCVVLPDSRTDVELHPDQGPAFRASDVSLPGRSCRAGCSRCGLGVATLGGLFVVEPSCAAICGRGGGGIDRGVLGIWLRRAQQNVSKRGVDVARCADETPQEPPRRREFRYCSPGRGKVEGGDDGAARCRADQPPVVQRAQRSGLRSGSRWPAGRGHRVVS